MHSERGREVDGVVPAEPMILGLLTGQMGEGVIDLDEVHLLEPGIELAHPRRRSRTLNSVESLGLGERGTCFWIDEPDAHDSISGVPEPPGRVRPGLGDQQGNDRRRVEVRDHLRCSTTRSDTGPFVAMGVVARCFSRRAGVTTPSATRAVEDTIVSEWHHGAIVRPRSVTTTSSPSRTRSR